MKNLYPIKNVSTSSMGEKVVAELRMRIISNAIPNGTVLSENKLSNEFEVSRSPIRDALKTLEKEDLIRQRRMGVEVIGLTTNDIKEIYDVRLMIESFVFERLLIRDNQELVKQLNMILEMMKIAVKYKDADEFSLKDIEFHETIIKSIEHRHLFLIWSNLKPMLECLILLSMRYRITENIGDFERIINNHQLIIQVIKNKDKQLAKEVFDKNFHDVANRVEDLWNNEEMLKKARNYHEKR